MNSPGVLRVAVLGLYADQFARLERALRGLPVRLRHMNPKARGRVRVGGEDLTLVAASFVSHKDTPAVCRRGEVLRVSGSVTALAREVRREVAGRGLVPPPGVKK